MNVLVQLDKIELIGLESVAEGRASAVPEHIVSRLLGMGLVQKPHRNVEPGAAIQLTPMGLSFIRSSDQ